MIRTERSSFKHVLRMRGADRPRSSPHQAGAGRRIFPPRLRRGTRHPDAPLPPRSASESVRADTLRAHPENAAAPAQYPSAERRYRPKVTSGCPKRSEGGFPVGTRTITAFPCGIQAEPCIPRRTWNGVKHERGAASHTGDSASFVRTGSAEELSPPRRTQPESAHARGRRQPDRG